MDVAAGELEAFRPELTGYCYRMLGSGFEAEDAVQDTMVRAWRGLDRFEGRSAVRSWLYRIATNVCLDMLAGAQRRVRPMDLGPAGSGAATHPGEPGPEAIWVGPVPDTRVARAGGDPAEVVAGRETIRLAFVAALQHLPPRQRAVLILREVLAFSAQETAVLLGATVAGVNSALQRARATLAAAADTGAGGVSGVTRATGVTGVGGATGRIGVGGSVGVTGGGAGGATGGGATGATRAAGVGGDGVGGDGGVSGVSGGSRGGPSRRDRLEAAAAGDPLDDEQKRLLERYVTAFEAYDLPALTALLHEDATLSMPPLPLWLRGPADIATWMSGTGSGCRGSRLLPVWANGQPAFGQFRPGPDGTGYVPWALIVLDVSGDRIAGVANFLDTGRLFPLFGLPPRL
ncbi:sigma-70 family RNA polymerase sigma factor [Actinoplanes rectilineatus]|uniref:sigma-70 family RNA polymerase sigma factor n=1 Tax=Actinoplanes rectilineatus TaxID=113571 RepID=UPI001FE091F3|nr:sigma-70 family RNA polymerase sigma factor [Actinoplanes rectilineatus]